MGKVSIGLVFGPMFAGKTTRLIADVQKSIDGNIPHLILAPIFDSRVVLGETKNHNGVRLTGIVQVQNDDGTIRAVETLADGIPGAYAGPVNIFVDECQFFTKDIYAGDFLTAIQQAIAAFIENDVNLIFYGLDMDVRCQPWPATEAIQCVASWTEGLKATCHVCSAMAAYTARVDGSDATLEVGGADKYEARCPLHHPVITPDTSEISAVA